MKYELSTDEAWRKIRAMRHQPPANADRKPRKLLFAAAMKQSEQFFRLSDQAGYEVKPILLYYGLNQATRGIVAAAARPDEGWQFNGHGLTCPNLNQQTALGDVEVVDHGKGKSFQLLAKYTYCPTLPVKVQFRELWVSLPEGSDVPLQGSYDLCTAVKLSQHGTAFASLYGLPSHQHDLEGTAKLRRILRERFPSLRQFEPRAIDGVVSTLKNAGSDRGNISLTFAPDAPAGLGDYAAPGYGPKIYSSSKPVATWIIPTVAGNAEPLSPIVTWGAVLYTLSMLARYQPSSWTKMLDIDTSPDAPAVEYLLDESHRACVNLIVDVFQFVMMGFLADSY